MCSAARVWRRKRAALQTDGRCKQTPDPQAAQRPPLRGLRRAGRARIFCCCRRCCCEPETARDDGESDSGGRGGRARCHLRGRVRGSRPRRRQEVGPDARGASSSAAAATCRCRHSSSRRVSSAAAAAAAEEDPGGGGAPLARRRRGQGETRRVALRRRRRREQQQQRSRWRSSFSWQGLGGGGSSVPVAGARRRRPPRGPCRRQQQHPRRRRHASLGFGRRPFDRPQRALRREPGFPALPLRGHVRAGGSGFPAALGRRRGRRRLARRRRRRRWSWRFARRRRSRSVCGLCAPRADAQQQQQQPAAAKVGLQALLRPLCRLARVEKEGAKGKEKGIREWEKNLCE